MPTKTMTYPPEGMGPPKDRLPGPLTDVGLPAGTEVFSADNHISLAEDIFYEQFPAAMKDRAPRVVNVDGGWVVADVDAAGPDLFLTAATAERFARAVRVLLSPPTEV